MNCEDYAHIVRSYAWDATTALAIMRAESGCRADAVGDTTLTYQGDGRTEGMSCGLFQVRVLAGRPDCDTLNDPATNVAWAWRIYQARGNFTAWSVYLNQKYLEYL